MAALDILDDADMSSSTLDIRLDRERNKSNKSSASKSKDLSHVPCKFFRVGSCTAGSSCPFSHSVVGPGQQKDVCAWFVKGNCKFGHKCALAHVLPGQSSAMDRRNKKAAQLAASAGGGGGGGGGSVQKDRERERERDSRGRKSSLATSGQGAGRGGPPSRSNTLLSGSTAPTRMLPTGARPPLPISISKAAPAPAETAPALQDADFTSYDPFSKTNEQTERGPDAREVREEDVSNEKADGPTNGVSSPKPADAAAFPVSTPSKPHRFTGRHGSSPSIDFGPVGSPPRVSPSTNTAANTNPIRINGFSPGTSPRDAIQATQPLAAGPTFSAPGANLFMHPSSPRGTGSGLAASLSIGGTQALSHTQSFAVGSLPVLSRPIADPQTYAEALDDEDMEEFVPSSLKDLLTPEEQSRRMSRTSSSQTGAGIAGGGGGIATRSGVQREESRHRHSHSVPSASLLSQNLRSIWADAGGELGQENVGFGMSPSAGGAGALGTSPSFASSPALHAFDNDGPSPSMLSPSNASAAFLGLNQYMGPTRVPGGVSAVRAVSHGNVHHQAGLTSANLGLNPSASSSFDTLGNRAHALSSSPSQLARPPFDAFSSPPSKYTLSPHRPVPAAASAAFRAPDQTHALSPGSRALQAHVPGQSLPQGLAAGFSRIHLQPTTAFSPGSHGSDVGAGTGASVSSNGSGMEWMSATPTKQHHFEQPVAAAAAAAPPSPSSAGSNSATAASEQPAPAANTDADVGGLTTVFSHLSYSSVAASGLRGHPHPHPHPHGSPAAAVPTSMSRRSSARGWNSHPLSSPLSGPVLTNDDDDLFSMDEEK